MSTLHAIPHEHNKELIDFLNKKAKILRKHVLDMIKASGTGWLGGSYSMAEVIAALYFHHMRHDPRNPNWNLRDRLVMSKAHCCEIVYAALAEAGYFPKDELQRYGRLGSLLQAHTDRRIPGVEYSGGSLGLGLSFAVGLALAARISHREYKVFCILGDGECQEGQVWEAALFAAQHKLDNLIALVDYNKFQSTGRVIDKIDLEPLTEKWRAFGWHVMEIDGHDIKQILDALDIAETVKGKPHVIICHTIKGKGVPSLEGKNPHFIRLTDELYAEIVKALEV